MRTVAILAAPREAPHPGHVAAADIPIFLVEVVGAEALLGLTGAWWAPLGALLTLLVARALTALVGCIVACGLARVWVALAVVHLNASPAAVARPAWPYCAIGPSRGSRPWSSKARKRLKSGCAGPWKSAEPVVSSPSSPHRRAMRRACTASCVG